MNIKKKLSLSKIKNKTKGVDLTNKFLLKLRICINIFKLLLNDTNS